MGGLDGPAAAEQPALAEQVVAQAGAVGAQVGDQLGGQGAGAWAAWAAAASFSAT